MKEAVAERKSWEEFRKSGLLWFINQTLHLFGWAIVLSIDLETGKITDSYPARVNFRGFPEEVNTKGYIKLTEYINNNITVLVNDVKEEDINTEDNNQILT